MGCPPQFSLKGGGEDQWYGKGGVVQVIKRHLDIQWKRQHVKATLDKTREHFLLGTLHTFDAGKEGTGNGAQLQRKKKLSDKEVQLALKTVRDSLGLGTALRRVNDFRRRQGKKGVCYETLRRALEYWGAICHLRQTRKTGNRDPFSCWAVFRHQFCVQLQHQFHEDFELRDQLEGWNKLSKCGVLFCDEHHEKCEIGMPPSPSSSSPSFLSFLLPFLPSSFPNNFMIINQPRPFHF